MPESGPFLKVVNNPQGVLKSDKIYFRREGTEESSQIKFDLNIKDNTKNGAYKAMMTFCANPKPGIEFYFGKMFEINFVI